MPVTAFDGFIIKRNRTQVPFTGAKAITRVDCWEYPGEWYRDEMTAAKIGSPFLIPTEKGATTAKVPAITQMLAATTPPTGSDILAALQVAASFPEGVLEQEVIDRGYSLPFGQDDALLHAAPRHVRVRRTYIVFWDSENPQPGEAVERSGDTSSTVLVTNINVEGLYVGQGVTGSGIPAGTKIAEIIDTPPTASYDVYPPVITAGQRAIKLTKAATTTVIGGTLTFAAGTGLPVAECPADEYAGWSKEKAILLR